MQCMTITWQGLGLAVFLGSQRTGCQPYTHVHVLGLTVSPSSAGKNQRRREWIVQKFFPLFVFLLSVGLLIFLSFSGLCLVSAFTLGRA